MPYNVLVKDTSPVPKIKKIVVVPYITQTFEMICVPHLIYNALIRNSNSLETEMTLAFAEVLLNKSLNSIECNTSKDAFRLNFRCLLLIGLIWKMQFLKRV